MLLVSPEPPPDLLGEVVASDPLEILPSSLDLLPPTASLLGDRPPVNHRLPTDCKLSPALRIHFPISHTIAPTTCQHTRTNLDLKVSNMKVVSSRETFSPLVYL